MVSAAFYIQSTIPDKSPNLPPLLTIIPIVWQDIRIRIKFISGYHGGRNDYVIVEIDIGGVVPNFWVQSFLLWEMNLSGNMGLSLFLAGDAPDSSGKDNDLRLPWGRRPQTPAKRGRNVAPSFETPLTKSAVKTTAISLRFSRVPSNAGARSRVGAHQRHRDTWGAPTKLRQESVKALLH